MTTILNDVEVYERLNADLTSLYLSRLQSLLCGSVEYGIILKKTGEKLLPAQPLEPYWDFLPKVHIATVDSLSRLIVSGTSSVTETLSHYLDWFQKLLRSRPSCLLDMGNG